VGTAGVFSVATVLRAGLKAHGTDPVCLHRSSLGAVCENVADAIDTGRSVALPKLALTVC
jgi:hypothetical protein